jgi:hypothetical protein
MERARHGGGGGGTLEQRLLDDWVGEEEPSCLDTVAARRHALKLVWLAVVVDYALGGALIATLPFLFPVQQPVLLGLLFALRPLVQALVAPWLPALARQRVRPISVLLGGLVLLACACAALAATAAHALERNRSGDELDFGATRLDWLFAARGLHALASALVLLGGTDLVRAMHAKRRERRRASASALSGVSFGALLGPLAGGLSMQLGPRALLLIVLGGCAVLVALGVALVALAYGDQLVVRRRPASSSACSAPAQAVSRSHPHARRPDAASMPSALMLRRKLAGVGAGLPGAEARVEPLGEPLAGGSLPQLSASASVCVSGRLGHISGASLERSAGVSSASTSSRSSNISSADVSADSSADVSADSSVNASASNSGSSSATSSASNSTNNSASNTVVDAGAHASTVSSETVGRSAAATVMPATLIAGQASSDGERSWLAADPYIATVCALLALGNGALAAMEPVLPRFAVATFALSPLQTALLWSAAPLAYLLAGPVAVHAVRRHPLRKARVVAAAVVLYCVAPLVATRFAGSAAGQSLGSLPLVVLALAALAFATGLLDAPAADYLRDVLAWRRTYDDAALARALRLQDQASQVGLTLGPIVGALVAGAQAEHWHELALGTSATLGGAGVVLLAALYFVPSRRIPPALPLAAQDGM